MRGWNGG